MKSKLFLMCYYSLFFKYLFLTFKKILCVFYISGFSNILISKDVFYVCKFLNSIFIFC